jgi:hypothetical protein
LQLQRQLLVLVQHRWLVLLPAAQLIDVLCPPQVGVTFGTSLHPSCPVLSLVCKPLEFHILVVGAFFLASITKQEPAAVLSTHGRTVRGLVHDLGFLA